MRVDEIGHKGCAEAAGYGQQEGDDGGADRGVGWNRGNNWLLGHSYVEDASLVKGVADTGFLPFMQIQEETIFLRLRVPQQILLNNSVLINIASGPSILLPLRSAGSSPR